MPAQAARPVLVFDRIDANRRNARLLVGLSTVLVVPFLAYLWQYLTMWIWLFLVMFFGGDGPDGDVLTASAMGLAVACTILLPYLVWHHGAALLLRLSGARPPVPGEGGRLSRIVENLSIGSGLPEPRLMVLDTDAANAFSTGLSPEDATLVVTRGLLERLDRRELEAVVAQELCQIGNHDVLLESVLSAVLTVLLAPLRGLAWLVGGRSDQGRRGGVVSRGCLWALVAYLALSLGGALVSLVMMGEWALPAALLGALFLLFGAPLVCLLLYRAVSREREFLADADAVLLTRNPGALAGALRKLGAAGAGEVDVSPALANLFFVDPRPARGASRHGLTAFHPPVDERLRMLGRLGAPAAVGP